MTQNPSERIEEIKFKTRIFSKEAWLELRDDMDCLLAHIEKLEAELDVARTEITRLGTAITPPQKEERE